MKWTKEHRREYMRKWYAKNKRKAQKKDVLETGGELGRLRVPSFAETRELPVPERANGQFNEALKFLRIQRILADERITQIDKAIAALEALK